MPDARDTHATTQEMPAAHRDWAARLPFFYGWVMLALSLVILVFSGPGQTWLLGQFTNRFLEDFGLGKAAFNTGYAVATLLASLPMPFIGAWMDRFGLRNATIASAVVLLAAAVIASVARGPITLFTGILLFRLAGQGALGMISGHALAKWFRDRLGSVEGIRHAINGAVISVVPPLVVLLIGATGWRRAILLIGVVTAAVLIPLVLLAFRETPATIGQQIDGGPRWKNKNPRPSRSVRQSLNLSEAIRTRAFWVLGLTPCATVTATTALILNMQPMMAEVGVGEERAALLITVFAGVNVPLQFLFGWLVDRTPSWFTVVVTNASLALGCGLMLGRESWAIAVAANVALAFCHGSLWSTNGALLVRFFGLDHQGAIRGVMTNITVVGSASGPVVVGAFVSLTGAYDAALIFFSCFALAVLGLSTTIREPAGADMPFTAEEHTAAARTKVELDAEEF